jgi:uncharacterized protein (UPF0332 family)
MTAANPELTHVRRKCALNLNNEDKKNMTIDRKQIARVYKLKSDESYLAAQECLRKDLYRGTCNRAWYAVMQIITAAVYEDLTEAPPKGKENWDHERQGTLFRSIASKHKVWEQYKHLLPEINMMRDRRNDADYIASQEQFAHRKAAEKSFQIAGQVRESILKLLGDRWQINEPLGVQQTGETNA